ncbi:SET domain-containing protein SmydA-8-like [Megalopta genalis]|uniref:SET domain-containing protein SmydA-8-like n=1 Tax=Megalopta genalis TaxID=115081 RepID=UPI003FD62859
MKLLFNFPFSENEFSATRAMESKSVCEICGKVTTLTCSACKSVYYCCKDHQKKDWSKHVKICRPYKLTENPILGRHYVATRNIKVGEILIKEAPLFSGSLYNSDLVCLGCLRALHEGSAIPCTKCGCLLCLSCKQHGPECDFISSRRIGEISVNQFSFLNKTYQYMPFIKILAMKHAHPETYEKLLSLESHSDNIIVQAMALPVYHFIRIMFKSDDITIEEITRIVGIVKVNPFLVTLTDPPHMAIYELSSLIEHNCKANCWVEFQNRDELIIRARTPIAKGDHISISYINSLLGTENRLKSLHNYLFQCTCDRCKDPSEFGVMFNALKCNKRDCAGYVLPETFLGTRPKPYVCATCKSSISPEKVDWILKMIDTKVELAKRSGITACDEFLKYSKDILHPNHFCNVDVMLALHKMIDVEDPQQANKYLQIKRKRLSKKLYSIFNIISPNHIKINL